MKKFLSSLFIVFSILTVFNLASAQILDEDGDALKLMKENAEKVSIIGGFAADASVGSIIAAVIKAVLGLLAVIFLVLMVFAGFKWMMAQGNEDQIKKSLETIKAAAIGLIIVLSAYAITYFIFTYLPFDGPGSVGSLTTSP